ncbi:MAG: acyltransferase family protein [Rhodospirillales bacterium]
MRQTDPSPRIPALDGLRGMLALVVLTYHVAFCLGTNALGGFATAAVWCFLVISGYVLTPAYDGRYWAFLARRAVRLWPVYAVGLLAGALVQKPPFSARRACLVPRLQPSRRHDGTVQQPARVVAVRGGMGHPFIPFIAWFGRGSLWRAALIPPLWLAAWLIPGPLFWLGCFLTGAALSRFKFRFRPLETRAPQWLGKISYSLYLSHMPVLSALLVRSGARAWHSACRWCSVRPGCVEICRGPVHYALRRIGRAKQLPLSRPRRCS